VLVINILTMGLGGIIWAFFYNKSYTTKLLEKGYKFADSDGMTSIAKAKLGIAG